MSDQPDTFPTTLPGFPDPVNAAIRRYFVEGNGSIVAGGTLKSLLLLRLPLVSDRTYFANMTVVGRIANTNKGTFTANQQTFQGSWDGAAWTTNAGAAIFTSFDAGAMGSGIGLASPVSDGFSISLNPDKNFATSYWWRVEVVETDLSFPLLP